MSPRAQGYRLTCRNPKCSHDFHRGYRQKEFEELQYPNGIACFDCGFPRMIIMKSHRKLKDTFVPGFQRNIMKHCETYQEYKAHLGRMGLIELGYEDLPDGGPHRAPYWNDVSLRKLHEKHGVKLSGREAEHFKNIHLENKRIMEIDGGERDHEIGKDKIDDN